MPVTLLSTIRRSLDRDRELDLTERIRKGGRFVTSSALAPFFLRGATCVGPRARTVGRPRVENAGTLHIGADFLMNSEFCPAELWCGEGATLEIGDQVVINFGTVLAARTQLRLGDRVSLGPYCVVADFELPQGGDSRPVEIGDGVWLAGRVTVLPGTKIGAGSVITAGSVVSGEIPPGVVAGGVPARVLRRVDGAAAGPVPPPTRTLTVVEPELRGVVLADFTLGDLATRLRDPSELPAIELVETPYAQVMQQLVQGPPDGARDFALIWTRPELCSESFAKLLHHEPATVESLEADVDLFVDRVLQGASAYRHMFVASWSLAPDQRGLGLLDSRPPLGASWALSVMNARLMARLSNAPNTFVLDAQRWVAAGGRAGTSAKGWYLGKVRHQGEVLAEAARELKAALRACAGQARKLVVVDLDETLWGGIVGEVGWQGLHLGGHDPEGEALVDFQRQLKDLTRRGVVLAIASKNDEAVAMEAIEQHPEMVLRRADFVGWRINWRDKARNVAELAQELNLGLQSVVFIDDNPTERARVREALPEVLVPDWPTDKLRYPEAMRALRCFDAPYISSEDLERTRLYAAERARTELKQEVGDLDAWLQGLEIRVRMEPLSAANQSRVVQLLNKTNQLNLSTRRLGSAELEAWASEPNRKLWAATVSDRFGDAGLTGLVSVEVVGETARIVDLVLSCRVMGRKVELALLHHAVAWASGQGATRVEARYLKTAKNRPTLEVLVGSGFEAGDGRRFTWETSRPYELPRCITLVRVG
ncbi:MAG: HAD-IIIC family phosphatase [Deltaproteobacteria bacterium]|nr:HAD-IIIC family phosphatase [Deltaproteobacteria bacterium]